MQPFSVPLVAITHATFSVLVSFGCGIMSLLSSFGHHTPVLLNKIIKIIFILCTKMNYGGDHAPDTISSTDIP